MPSPTREATRPPERAPEPPRVRTAPAPSPAGGLPTPVASAISTSLGVDVSPVRVHADGNAATATSMFGARALTIGSHIFLGARERASDVALMAHEVAHVAQQRGAPRVQLWNRAVTDPCEREAHGAAAAVLARRPFTVRERTQPRIQRFGISDLLDWFADKANNIPGYRMFTIIIGVNPINGARVERTGANILRAAVEFIPGGHLIVEALDKYGVFEKAGAWLERQVATLGMTARMFIDALHEFIDSLGWRDIFHPGRVWDRAKEIFLRPIRRLIDFFVGLVKGILELIKQAILKPLAKLAEGTPAWDLLLQVLGQNPITGEPVPRSADKLIGGFMKLIRQEEIWNNIKRANAIPRAFDWFRGALSGLLAFVAQIPRMFLDALRSLEIADIVLLPRAFVKVGRAFVGIAGRFFSWAVQQVLGLLQIIFEVVAPAVVPYIRKAAGAFNGILRNPVRFLGNLVRTGRQGFDNFRKNFLGHLRKSLIDWLTGTLSGAGVYIPQAFELKEIVKFVLSVLGLTWHSVRSKLLKLIPEPALKAIETGLDIVVTLVREGPAAAWEKIKESLSNLKEMVIEQVMSFVKGTIVEQAITKLLSLLSPVGAFIQAVIGIYNTIMFFIERLRQIAQVVASFIDSIAAIASGAVGAAAARVESTLAGFLTTVISFLARFAGLGNVSDMIKKVVDRIRTPIDNALDRVVDWIISIGRRIGRFFAQVVGGGKPTTDARTEQQKQQDVEAAVREAQALLSARDATPESVTRALPALKAKYHLTSAALEQVAPNEYDVLVVINPRATTTKKKFDPSSVKKGDMIRVKFVKEGFLERRDHFDEDKYRFVPADVTDVQGTTIFYTTRRSKVSGRVEVATYEQAWIRILPGTSYAIDEAWQKIKDLGVWANFNDARQVLNWRRHKQFSNPGGHQWEHIVEQTKGGGEHSVANLALTTETLNQEFNVFFGRAHGTFDGLPSTDGKPLRDFLTGKSKELWREWKLRAYSIFGVRIARKSVGIDGEKRGDYQVLE